MIYMSLRGRFDRGNLIARRRDCFLSLAMTTFLSIFQRRGRLLYFAIIFLSLFLPSISFAGAPVHGAKAAAMGTAFVAIADDSSAITHNPAGLTQLTGTNIYGGMTFVIPSTTYTSPSGRSEETDFQIFFPPHLYISSDLNTTDFRFGVGIFSPFGIGGRKWSNEGLTKYSSTER